MFSVKSVLICSLLVALVSAYPQPQEEEAYLDPEMAWDDSNYPLVRLVRSPEGGSVVLTASKDQAGREASVQYNHNLYTSRDGRGTIDAYAQASRNFDYNRNNYGGGIQGRWSF
ncbi:uncharacterized protein Dwil_GK17745 [Drosophila willistoni]|uniref:Attacin C-terminal domain-containing protein n=1 Tax=Drosophila willistoni TaxID=7260 RepID=B4N6F1_DROWI|nr:uncharacterized protein LOC6646009 [Drosophila willistoni]EDW79940.2 uncharacterized protein Dwil_GK17745 [Drosophila willistoni]